MKCIAIVPIALALVACSGSEGNVDLGDDQVDSVASGLEDYEGTWQGYAEAYKFDSDSDRLEILLDAQGHGTVEFGAAEPIAPFTDPNTGYLVDPRLGSFMLESFEEPRGGFPYPVHDASVDSGRIRFTMWGTDVVSDWCEAQTVYLDDVSQPASYTCSPTGLGYTQTEAGCYAGDGTDDLYDCGQLETCFAACSCDESSCQGRRQPGGEMTLDGAIEVATGALVGTLVVGGDRVTVRLTRQ